MQKWLGAGVLGCAWLVACGGKLVAGGSQGNGGAPSAGAPSAGAPSAGASNPGAGSPSAGGSFDEPDADPPCRDDNFLPCAASCGSAQTEYIAGECHAGKWTCPAPYVGLEACSADSCVMQLHTCCDHEYGKRTQPPCASDGRFAACPAGLERDAQPCVADSAHTTNCGSLDSQSCTLVDARCDAGDAHCECHASEDGGLVWSCAYDLK